MSACRLHLARQDTMKYLGDNVIQTGLKTCCCLLCCWVLYVGKLYTKGQLSCNECQRISAKIRPGKSSPEEVTQKPNQNFSDKKSCWAMLKPQTTSLIMSCGPMYVPYVGLSSKEVFSCVWYSVTSDQLCSFYWSKLKFYSMPTFL